jgi:hypothetical protein
VFGAAAHAGAAACPWMNAKLAPDQRGHMLVAAMTLDQKIAMVHGDTYPGHATGGTGAGSVPAIASLCIPALGLADGAGGLGNGNTGVTAFPAPIAQAAAFDTAQQQAFGQAIGQEFVGKAENQWARAQRQHRTLSAERPELRGLRGGPVPRRSDGRFGHRRRPEPARDRHG